MPHSLEQVHRLLRGKPDTLKEVINRYFNFNFFKAPKAENEAHTMYELGKDAQMDFGNSDGIPVNT